VLRAGAKVLVNGFSPEGGPVNGNSAWFQNEDGDFFWADHSSVPEPRPQPDHELADAVAPRMPEPPETDSATALPVAPTAGCPIGISEIDQFLTTTSCAPLELAKGGRDTLGAIQDLLTGHCFPKLPSLLSPGHGI
jgi:hypothetical protein